MMDRHSRRGATKAYLREGRAPGARNVVVCVGDSITEGVSSADWVAMLRERGGAQGVQVVNAGVAGDLAWNVLQRLDSVVRCDPDTVTVMVGTNDVALEPQSAMGRLTLRMKGVRLVPTLERFVENVSVILRRLRSDTHAKVARRCGQRGHHPSSGVITSQFLLAITRWDSSPRCDRGQTFIASTGET